MERITGNVYSILFFWSREHKMTRSQRRSGTNGSVSFVCRANSDIYGKQERVAVAGCLLFQVINIEMLLPGHTDRDYEGKKSTGSV